MMTRARILIAAGAGLILLSLFVRVPLNGILGLATTAVVSMALLIAGVAGVANGIVMLRRFKGR
jgi:hypothetical protein